MYSSDLTAFGKKCCYFFFVPFWCLVFDMCWCCTVFDLVISTYFNHVNGHRNADKRANSFWQFLHFFPTELLVFLVCRQTDKEFRLPWPSFVRVEIYYRYRLSINRKYRLPNRESSVAKWLERRPLDPEVMSSNPGLYIFLIKGYFFISLSF